MSKKIRFQAEFEELSWEELSTEEQQLMMRARRISETAYAPYSAFQVGAALRLESGEILQSSNQENVSFPVGTCAERLVLGYAGANFSGVAVKQLAIAARRRGDEVWAKVSPCGMCRQAINETEMRFGSPISLLLQQANGDILRFNGIQSLLPFKFDDLNA
ncbi:cytidine deaminase [Algoriphagus halophytocola]|uniref:Cytidine deaminase n=1 Tax=Algoriphagus halophytocola TaxID=2991499 RepID=A0ABY6ME86_9BACT|nr:MULTISPECIES: cytidine deaminase [unclassified Algoriphagus]UZD21220.1 cytidine deaminase [Algoriphagus sp. TR-M5]WBL42431.1 cytidine deaminase [Algoriphagus sp. TR-M9]